ncbi:guanylate-binding protein 6-like [Lithobates pipiens]
MASCSRQTHKRNARGELISIKMKAPVCLIENTVEDGNAKLVVNPEAITILSKIHQPVVVVSIVGLYRTGKSYLMNKLAGAQKGFSLGATVQSKTKGIWMWCVPHPTKSNHTLVLLDTEGLGDVEKGDNRNDVWIFSLAVLLSSALVYNSKGTIDQDAMDKLKFVGEITELIKVKTKDNEDEEAEFSSHFPIFIWAVRDFHLQLEIDGKRVSGDQYLENALKLKHPVKTTRDESYNRPRECIRIYFGRRKCFLFPFPTIREEHLQKLEEVDDDELSDNFVAQSKKFCDYIFQNAEVKGLKEVLALTGSQLGDLAKIYTEAISSSNIACMEDAVVSLADKENKVAAQEAGRLYEDMMKEVALPTETLDNFLGKSQKCEAEARALFLKKSFKDKDQKFLKLLMEHLVNKKQEFIAKNEEKSREVCRAIIKKHSEDFEKALSERKYIERGGYAKFKKALKTVEDKYNKERGKGVKAEEVLQEYMKSKKDAEIYILKEDTALSQKEKDKEEAKTKKKCEEMEKKVQELEEAKQKLMEEAQNNCNEETVKMLTEKMERDRELMAEKMEKIINDKERERELFLQQGLEKQARMFQEQIADLKRQRDITDFGVLNPLVNAIANPIRGFIKLCTPQQESVQRDFNIFTHPTANPFRGFTELFGKKK